MLNKNEKQYKNILKMISVNDDDFLTEDTKEYLILNHKF